nr:bifunctional hydroxymethylpyrimidine kinase/phosphomethylpyrimidine kinase [Glycomyces sp. L485]
MTIAGSDSGGCAGIQADLRTFAAHRVHGTSVVTALTAQNTVGVRTAQPVGADFVRAQLDAVLDDFEIAAVKTGMLADPDILKTVGWAARSGRLPNLVVDPVMIATSGDTLFEGDAAEYLRSLGDSAVLLTPNLSEADTLGGVIIHDEDDMRTAARLIAASTSAAVLVTGGHLNRDSSLDLLCIDGECFEFESERVDTDNTHGTGCTLSAAITANLALGHDLLEAVAAAKQYVTGALTAGADLRLGQGSGPVDHMWWFDGEK